MVNMMNKNKLGRDFNPLIFLMALGAGGISIIPFAFFQYTLSFGKGLVQMSSVGHGSLPLMQEILFRLLEGVMIVFGSIHLILSAVLFVGLIGWMRIGGHEKILQDPLKNANLLAPFISLVMTMNVFIGPVRYFVPVFANNLQVAMLPALIFWSLIWIVLLRTDMKLLRISFEKSFDVNKISFGWLLHSFALAMLTVTGTGIAALARDASVAHIAAFMSLVSGTMGIFLLSVKLIAIFKSHFAQSGLPERQFLPSFLIVVPNITLFAISIFRFGHYLEHHHGMHMGAFFLIVMTVAFAFESWYLVFGLTLLSDYFKKHFFSREFYVTQWGLVCPVVAYAVLGSFVYKVFLPSLVLYSVILLTALVSVVLFFYLFVRQGRCSGILKKRDIECI